MDKMKYFVETFSNSFNRDQKSKIYDSSHDLVCNDLFNIMDKEVLEKDYLEKDIKLAVPLVGT
jgi:hypothetical protein